MTGLAIKAGLRATAPLRRRPPPNPFHRSNALPKRSRHSTAANPPDAATTNGTSIPIPSTIPALPLWQRLGPLTTALEALGRAQRKRPWTTQLISTVVVYLLGDIGAQAIRDEEYEPVRTGRAMVIGAGAAIPLYTWFMYLGNSFNYASPLLSLATKVVINQITFTPLFNAYFFGMQAVLSGEHALRTWEGALGVMEHIKRTVPTSWVNSCKLWPAVTALSFAFVPAHFRSLFGGVFAIGWQAYLSFLNRQVEGEEAVGEGGEQRVLDEVKRGGQGLRVDAKSSTSTSTSTTTSDDLK